jgi:ABC-type xylose transport system permease subunit
MFFVLLALTLGVALATAAIVVAFFNRPIRQILDRIVNDPVSAGWHRFLLFAVFVVGVSNGVQIWKLEQYLHPEFAGPRGEARILTLDGPSIALEIYRTVILVLQGVAWALLVFFVVALIAFAIIRRSEGRPAEPRRTAAE